MKVRDGQVTNRPVYVVIGVTVAGERDILGLWAGDGGEGAKFWLAVLTEIKNRGVADVCIAVCDGLKGLPEAITTVWPQTLVPGLCAALCRPPDYADQVAGSRCRAGVSGWRGRHNQSPSSQASRLSGGWYRPVRPLGGRVLASASPSA